MSFLTLCTGISSVWIEKKKDYDDVQVLDFIDNNDIFPPVSTMLQQQEITYAIFVSPTREIESLDRWCMEHKGWGVVKYSDVTGSEFPFVVAIVEDDRTNLEVFSRAQLGLVIVTK